MIFVINPWLLASGFFLLAMIAYPVLYGLRVLGEFFA
jgi:hypothetical protein